jgi:hypothetical protein
MRSDRLIGVVLVDPPDGSPDEEERWKTRDEPHDIRKRFSCANRRQGVAADVCEREETTGCEKRPSSFAPRKHVFVGAGIAPGAGRFAKSTVPQYEKADATRDTGDEKRVGVIEDRPFEEEHEGTHAREDGYRLEEEPVSAGAVVFLTSAHIRVVVPSRRPVQNASIGDAGLPTIRGMDELCEVFSRRPTVAMGIRGSGSPAIDGSTAHGG